ncbi:MAG TPA: HD domain-containing protein [Anaerolineales bacterium]|nr:HD domain-containing protein [Anaerolineales bacterium]
MNSPLSLKQFPLGVQHALLALKQAGGEIYWVGGGVRDAILGIPVQDFDIEVFGIGQGEILSALRKVGAAQLIGKSFGIIEARPRAGGELDVSMPRDEYGNALRPYATPVSLTDSASRRDFTINALYVNPFAGQLIDVVGGMADLQTQTLRHISPAFAQDPLRVLRGMKLCARYALSIAPETVQFLQTLHTTPTRWLVERSWPEWEDWAESAYPQHGLSYLQKIGWLAEYPALQALVGCAQDPTWHPEGDVWTHTLFACEYAAHLAEQSKLSGRARQVLVLAALCHDLGKPICTYQSEDGHIRSPEHDIKGVPIAQTFLTQIVTPQKIISQVLKLIRYHMIHNNWEGLFAKDNRVAVQILADKLVPATIRQWEMLVTADASARPPLPEYHPGRKWLSTAETWQCADGAQADILTGAFLLQLGAQPGPAMGSLLDRAHNAQISGAFTDLAGAVRWLAQNGGSIRLLSGEDLLLAGVSAGPQMGALLHKLLELQLAQQVTTREQALAWLASELSTPK